MVLWRAHGNANIALLCWRGDSDPFRERFSSSQPFKITCSDANLHPSSLFRLCAIVAEVDEEKIKKLVCDTVIFSKLYEH